jgi:LmbE family N-acetylglucosaminyl deacetylase
MIVPIVEEHEWINCLDALASWQPPAASLLVIAPHPDDETLAVGGLIAAHRAKGLEVIVAAVTDGENAYPDFPGLGDLRSGEQREALNRLGVGADNIVRLKLSDSGVASQERLLVEQLMPLVSRSTSIVAPWRGDFHPDHEACGRAAEEVARRTGASLTSYFFWTWHRGTTELLQEMSLHSFSLSDESLLAKSEALLCHRSQLARESGDPILPESLLAPARRSFEVFSIG